MKPSRDIDMNRTIFANGSLPRLAGGAVDVEHRGVVRFRLDELESDWRRKAFEQREPVPERHWLQHEAVFVDEPEPCERLGEPGASPRDQVLSRLALQVGDLVSSAPRAMRDSGQSARSSVLEKTTLGMSFIGAA